MSSNGQPEYSFGNPPPMGNPVIGAMIGTLPAVPQLENMRKYRGDCLLQPFDLRRRFKESKEIMTCYGLGMPSPDIARVIGAAGYDLIFIDWEHTAIGIKELTELIRWVSYGGEGTTGVIVRVPTHDHCWISWALDAGASAVILPHTDNVEQAKAAVAAARFYTAGGHRSYPPFSMFLGVNDGDHKESKLPWDIYNRAAVICQIESAEGAKNADEIAAVEGVDGIMIGHMDLRFDLKLGFGGPMDEPEYTSAVAKILAAAKKHDDKPVLSFCQKHQQELFISQGYRILMLGADGMTLARGMRQELADAHESIKKVKAAGSKVENQ